jgi:hypothetical protein
MHRHPPSETEQRSRPRARCVHHRPDVIHPLHQARWPSDRIRQPSPPLVEKDHPGEGREPPQKPGQVRLLPGKFDMGDKARHEHQINRAIAKNLIGDAHLAALGISRGRHRNSLQAAAPTGLPASPGRLANQHPNHRHPGRNEPQGLAVLRSTAPERSTWLGHPGILLKPSIRHQHQGRTARSPAGQRADHPSRRGRLLRRSWPHNRTERRISRVKCHAMQIPAREGGMVAPRRRSLSMRTARVLSLLR